MCAQGAGSIFKKVKMKNNFETSKLSDRYPQTHLFLYSKNDMGSVCCRTEIRDAEEPRWQHGV